MKIDTKVDEDGFLVLLTEGGGRCRFINWSAGGAFGEKDSGRVDISMLAEGQGLPVKTNWRPEAVTIEPVRDPTPGMHSPYIAKIPPGASLLELVAETGISSHVKAFASYSGHHHDTKDLGPLPNVPPGSKLEIKIIMQREWSKIFIKKMDSGGPRICLSQFQMKTASGETFESMAHLIKPEHDHLLKEGKDGLLFLPEAREYSYFAMAFQRR